jgi:hypothetical protein
VIARQSPELMPRRFAITLFRWHPYALCFAPRRLVVHRTAGSESDFMFSPVSPQRKEAAPMTTTTTGVLIAERPHVSREAGPMRKLLRTSARR